MPKSPAAASRNNNNKQNTFGLQVNIAKSSSPKVAILAENKVLTFSVHSNTSQDAITRLCL